MNTTGIEKGITNDILAINTQQSLHYLGEITLDQIPSGMYGTYCIGK